MTAETLRKAAALMRELAAHANADHKAPWRHGPMLDLDNNGHFVAYGRPEDDYDNTVAVVPYDYIGATAEHIASWHPAIALAVADLLDAEAEAHSHSVTGTTVAIQDLPGMDNTPAMKLARAYLGVTS